MTPEWKLATVGSIITRCDYGLSCALSPDASGVPVLRMGNLQNGRVSLHALKYVSAERVSDDNFLEKDDLLLNRTNSADLVGKVGLFMGNADITFASYLFRLRVDSTKAAAQWLVQLLGSPRYQAKLRELATPGVGQNNINREALRALEIALPPLGEQRKIADILAAVDDAMEATQAVIDQLQVVKKAMMAELLTRGLPGRHTRHRKTEIGEVPESWEIVRLDEVARRGSGHTPSKSFPEYWNGNIKWLSLQDSKHLDRLYINDTTAKITPLGIENSSAVEHPAGTVVLSRDAGVGKSAITTDVMAVSQHFMAWFCGPRLNNHYLYYWLQYMKPAFERIAIGNTIKTIGLPYFKALRLAIPTRVEQDVIAEAIAALDLRTFAEDRAKAQLLALKSALMSVLLTGEVRVVPAGKAT